MIDIRNLTLSFADDPHGPPIVLGLDLHLVPGRVVSLFGPNGCGKTSLARWLHGYEPRRFVSNQNHSTVAMTRSVGYAAQTSLSVMEWLTSLDNIAITHRLQGRSWKVARETVMSKIGTMISGLPLHRRGKHLSGGEKQMVMLAREMAREPSPDLLIVDEGFVSMDYERRFRAIEAVRDWCQRTGASLLCVGHDAEEVTLFSDVTIVLTPRPARIVERVLVDGPRSRGINSLGQRWLNECTERVQAAFHRAVTMT